MPTPFPFSSGQVLTAAQLNAITELPTRTITTNDTAAAADSYKRVILNGTSITYTINTSTFSAGQVVELYNANSTAATIAAGAGVTLNGAAGLTLAQYQTAELYAISATSFVLWKSDSPATTSGLTVLKSETSFSASSSVTVDNVFTSNYTNYRIMIRYETAGSGVELRFRLRASGTSAATNYNYNQMIFDNTTSYAGRGSSQTSFVLSGQTNGSYKSVCYVDIFSPYVAEPTGFIAMNAPNQGAYTVPQVGQNSGNHSTATAYDGFEILTTSQNATGAYTVYGYAK